MTNASTGTASIPITGNPPLPSPTQTDDIAASIQKISPCILPPDAAPRLHRT
jgi:hypothetical protein